MIIVKHQRNIGIANRTTNRIIMEKIHETKLLYANEHSTCLHYLRTINSGFYYREYPSGHRDYWEKGLSKNYLLCLLKGAVWFHSIDYPPRTIHSGELLLLAKSSIVTGKCLSDTLLIILAFDELKTNCDKLLFESMAPLKKQIAYKFNSLPIRPPLNLFLKLLVYYLRNGANCAHLHEMKHNELFLCLRYFYTKEELVSLFYPIISKSLDFKKFILNNYPNVKNIQELIELSNMSKTVFYDRFKQEFGMTAKQWAIRQFSHKLLYTAARPGITVKELAGALDFDSVSQLQQYCKRHLNCTPSKLIEQQRAVQNKNRHGIQQTSEWHHPNSED